MVSAYCLFTEKQSDARDLDDAQIASFGVFEVPVTYPPHNKEMFRMVKPFIRRPIIWMLLVGLLVLAFALSACGGPAAAVHIKETKASSGDVYTCDPASISINKGDTVTFTNESDENQDFDMGDAQKAGVDFVVAINGSKDVTFNNAGTFTITSEKGASITVTVK
jgi:plastocyanin